MRLLALSGERPRSGNRPDFRSDARFVLRARGPLQIQVLSTDTAGPQARSELTGGPTSSNRAIPKTVSDTATQHEVDSTAAMIFDVLMTSLI